MCVCSRCFTPVKTALRSRCSWFTRAASRETDLIRCSCTDTEDSRTQSSRTTSQCEDLCVCLTKVYKYTKIAQYLCVCVCAVLHTCCSLDTWVGSWPWQTSEEAESTGKPGTKVCVQCPLQTNTSSKS